MAEGQQEKRRVILVTRLGNDEEWKKWEKIKNAIPDECEDGEDCMVFKSDQYVLGVVDGSKLDEIESLKEFGSDNINFKKNGNVFCDRLVPKEGDLVLIHYGGNSWSHKKTVEKFEKLPNNKRKESPLYAPLVGKKFTLGDYSLGGEGSTSYSNCFAEVEENAKQLGCAGVADKICTFFLL